MPDAIFNRDDLPVLYLEMNAATIVALYVAIAHDPLLRPCWINELNVNAGLAEGRN